MSEPLTTSTVRFDLASRTHGKVPNMHGLLGLPLVRCTRSLYRSTYRANAFTKGRDYAVVLVDHYGVWLLDNRGRVFGGFCDAGTTETGYVLSDYFTAWPRGTHA